MDEREVTKPTKLGATGLLGRVMAEASAARAQRLAAGEELIPGEPEEICERCKGAGYVRRRRLRPLSAALHGYVIASSTMLETDVIPCPHCRAMPTRDEQLTAANLFPVKTFEGWNEGYAPEMARAVLACHALIAGELRTVFLRGGVGRGKTHLAKATAVAWIDGAKGPASFVVVADMLDRLRQTQSEEAREQLVDLLQRYASVPLLVLDDLGAERPTAWAQEQLFKVIDRRTSQGRSLVVTSNIRPSEEEGRIEERVLSRLAAGEIVIVGGEDRRRRLGTC